MPITTDTTAETADRALQLMAAGEYHAAHLLLSNEGHATANQEMLRIANLILPCRMHTQAVIYLTRLQQPERGQN